ncbi:hypothetical protein A2011_00130 [candidate division CPR3 bacterium GWE2_35_7]|nr:MAG: hypothetical protein A2011_00130 [candidate division CPR3 bacterium GWE2_35_7]
MLDKHYILVYTNLNLRSNKMSDLKSKDELKSYFRKYSIKKIQLLNEISKGLSTTFGLKETIKMDVKPLGGQISSLVRTQIDGEPLIQPVARDEKYGIIWKSNDRIASKETINQATSEILKEVNEWQKSK